MNKPSKKILVAITGASGSIYAKILLDKLYKLQTQFKELSLLMSKNAKIVWEAELQNDDYKNLPFHCYDKNDFYAPFASGSAKYDTMIVVPCSMGTMGRIAAGVSDDLMTRAADVILKERRKLILAVRDTPYNLIHIKNMEIITLAGGIICPLSPSFYSLPKTVDEVASTVVDRILDICEFDHKAYRWGNEK